MFKVGEKVSRRPFLVKVSVNKEGDVVLHYGSKDVVALYANGHQHPNVHVNVTSYLDYTSNVLFYNFEDETLLIQYTDSNGKTEAWYYKQNTNYGNKYAGKRLSIDELQVLTRSTDTKALQPVSL